MNRETLDTIKVAALGLALGLGVGDLFTDAGLRKRIERLETDQQETLQIIKLHLENQHGITKATATNSTSITISNASEKTIQVVWPKPAIVYEAKEIE